MPKLSTAGSKRVPRWKVIHQWLHEQLGRFAYGSAFYTAAELCRQFEVSIITATRALNELADEGLIEQIQGKGNVVRCVPQNVSLWIVQPDSLSNRDYPWDSTRTRLLDGIRDTLKQQNLVAHTLNEQHLRKLFPREGEPAAGFLLLKPHGHETLQFLRQNHLPHVLVDPIDDYKGLPHARLDRFSSGCLATEYLLRQGHRRIGWITGHVHQTNFRERLMGYRKTLRKAGIPFTWKLIREVTDQVDERLSAMACEQALEELMKLRRRPTAIIMSSDSRAVHVLSHCARLGIMVPQHLSLIGFPNTAESTLTSPPLTVIDGNFEKVGAQAVKLLLVQMTGQVDLAAQASLIKPDIVIRSSVALLRAPVP